MTTMKTPAPQLPVKVCLQERSRLESIIQETTTRQVTQYDGWQPSTQQLLVHEIVRLRDLIGELQFMPIVHNKYHKTAPHDAVYIGRGSPYGNPFVIGKDGNRDEVCDKYESMLMSNPTLLQKVKTELKGKDLVCFCAPKRCHGDVLLKIANEAY